MSPCLPPKPNVRAPSYLHKIPCNVVEEEKGVKPCSHVVLQDLIDAALQPPEKKDEKKDAAKKKLPCDDVKPPSKKKFEQLGLKNICALPYTRHWTLEEVPCRTTNELPKWFKHRPEKKWGENLQPRELDDYEKRLRAPICKPPDTSKENCVEPIDDNVCVFCKNGFYTEGLLHDLLEKVPLIKKQSEIYGDEIAQRIGIRTRITVHKKCYDTYIDVFAHKSEEEGEKDLDDNVNEDSEEIKCGDEEEEEGDEEEEEDEENINKKKKDDEEDKKKRSEKTGRSLLPPNVNFCLKKFTIPPINPGKPF